MKDFKLYIFFFIAGIISRFPFVERMHSHVDVPTYIIALSNYSLVDETPTAPGYPLYFALAKLILFFTNNPYNALLCVSVLFSGIGAVVFFKTGKSLWNTTVGIFSGLLFLTTPTIYFFGITVYGFIVSITMMILVVWCVYEISFNKKKYGILIGFIYAIYIGFRPQEIIVSLPLFLYGLFYLSSKDRLKSIASFIVITILWFVPFISIVGGFNNFLSIYTKAAHNGLPFPTFLNVIQSKFALASGFYLTIGPIGIILLISLTILYIKKIVKEKNILFFNLKKIIFFSVWAIPSLLFNLLIRSDHAGYQMGYLTFFMFLVAFSIWKISRQKTILLYLLISAMMASNLFIFFYNRDPGYLKPYRLISFHHSDIRRNDYELSTKVNYIKKHFAPQKTLIIVGPVYWRQAMYYFPNYQIYEIDALFTTNSIFINTRRNAFNYKRHEFMSKNHSFKVPKGIDSIVVFDDETDDWMIPKNKLVQFKGMTRLTIIPVEEGETIKYSFKKIEIIKSKF